MRCSVSGIIRQCAVAGLLAVCLLGLFVAPRPAAAAGSLLLIDYPEYWPFFSRTDDGEMTGFFYEIVTEALNSMGIVTRWRAYPWARCQANVAAGESEAMVTVPTPERLIYSETHPDPFYMKRLNVFTYRDHPRLHEIERMKTLDDIKAANLTVVTYVRNGWNDRNIRSRGIKVYETPLIKSVWRMLAVHRGDIAIEWPVAAWADIRDTGVTADVVQTDVTFDPMPFHLMIGKRSTQTRLLPEFNRIILEMKKSGRIEEIVAKYTHPQ